ncbi:cell wall elongation regulator TseB-like domain-containing protein [Paenibacillus dakarensis]|uniref:cell wall elongation regulator TseB-like domain-containing protein n=1 Tax=Paenibacillus dakarensis TaxID=1527293 RepID=UPI0006D5AD63|nr:DUF5590 domain-containing protein [Paenibacillus dakarensis]
MKKKTKWALLSITGFLLIVLGIQIFYSYVMADTWNEEKMAIKAAQEYGGLMKTGKTYKSVWDKESIYWVVSGQNADNKDIMVWVKFTEEHKPAGQSETVHTELLSDGISEARMRNQIMKDLPGAAIERLVPGMYEGEYVWQLLYELNHEAKYRFYRFKDGAPIGEDLTLPNQ